MTKFKASYYNSELIGTQLTLESRCDKMGNVYHYVTYLDNNDVQQYVRFSKLSSAFDFINTNFQ